MPIRSLEELTKLVEAGSSVPFNGGYLTKAEDLRAAYPAMQAEAEQEAQRAARRAAPSGRPAPLGVPGMVEAPAPVGQGAPPEAAALLAENEELKRQLAALGGGKNQTTAAAQQEPAQAPQDVVSADTPLLDVPEGESVPVSGGRGRRAAGNG